MTIMISRRLLMVILGVSTIALTWVVGDRVGRYIGIRRVAAATVLHPAYTLKLHYTDGGMQKVVARRSNGELAVLATNVALPQLGYVSRHLQLNTGLDVTINEVLKTKSTNQLTTDQLYKRHQKQPFDPLSQCTAHVDPNYLQEATFTLDGADKVFGLDVYRVTLKRKGQVKTAWRAPSLNCDELKTVNQTYDDNGQVVRSNESIPDSLTIGEPDPNYFRIDGYVETAPADVEIAWVRRVARTEPPQAMIDSWRKIDERGYHPPK